MGLVIFVLIASVGFPWVVVRAETEGGEWRPRYSDGRYMSRRVGVARLVWTVAIWWAIVAWGLLS